MDMQGSRQLPVTQQQAWDALNDPAVLKACIPGCEKLEATGENQYSAVTALKIGPVSARFNGKVQLSEMNPPDSYKLVFDGQGGAAGFGKGTSQVTLAPGEGGQGTLLSYTVNAQVGGKIAQVGQRLIDGVAKSMAEDFFKRFEAELRRLHPAPEAVADAAEDSAIAAPVAASASPVPAGTPAWVWIAGGVVVLALVLWLMR